MKKLCACCTCCDGEQEKLVPSNEIEELEIESIDLIKIGYVFHDRSRYEKKNLGWYPWITLTIAASLTTFVQAYLSIVVHS